MRYKIPVITDTFFIAVTVFLFTFTAMRFSFSAPISFAVALIVSAGSSFLFWRVAKRKAEKKFLTKEDLKKRESVYRELGMMPYQKAERFFVTLLEKDLGRTLAPLRGNGKIFYRDEEEGINYAFFPSLFAVSQREVFEVWKENPSFRPMKVAAISQEEALPDFCKTIDVDLPQTDFWFYMMKRQGVFPQTQIVTKEKNKSVKGFFERLLSRKKSKRFFLFGSWMLLLSFLIPFPTYYFVTGSVFLLLSLLSRFFGKAE